MVFNKKKVLYIRNYKPYNHIKYIILLITIFKQKKISF